MTCLLLLLLLLATESSAHYSGRSISAAGRGIVSPFPWLTCEACKAATLLADIYLKPGVSEV
jgi:hypothetical protein